MNSNSVILSRAPLISLLILWQAWHDLAFYGHNWQHVDLFEFQVAIEGTVVERMSKQCGGFLRTLSLRDCEHVEDDALRWVGRGGGRGEIKAVRRVSEDPQPPRLRARGG